MNSLSEHIASIRTNYTLAALLESEVGDNPIDFFEKWFAEAELAEVTEVNAMALATVDSMQKPHCRIVLLKGFDRDKSFLFFTNYNSHKGQEIENNAHVAATFFWKELQRQVRIEGIITKTSDKESDDYFHSRPIGSQIGAWVSDQSNTIENRNLLVEKELKYTDSFGGKEVPRPEYWGGYAIKPLKIEFWQGRSNRLHDRILFEKEEASNEWSISRLQP